MRQIALLLLLVVVVAACGGADSPATSSGESGSSRAAVAYASSAMRALEGTAFEQLGASGVADVIVGLCDGLGVGAIGVAAADTGIQAGDSDVVIFLEVLRTGLDQVCEEKVVVDHTAIYLRSVGAAIDGLAAGDDAYDEIPLIRAAPVACSALESAGAPTALLAVVFTLYGVDVETPGELVGEIDADQGLVAGAALASAAALLCPEYLPAVEELVNSL